MASCRTCRWLGFAIRFSRGSQAVRRRLYHIPRRRGLPFDLTREGKVCGHGFFRGISQVSEEMKKEKGEGRNKKTHTIKGKRRRRRRMPGSSRKREEMHTGSRFLFLFRYTLSTTPIGGANLSRIFSTLIASNFIFQSSDLCVDFSPKYPHPHYFENVAPSEVRKRRKEIPDGKNRKERKNAKHFRVWVILGSSFNNPRIYFYNS